jgi:cytochrome b6-f complex subunit 8
MNWSTLGGYRAATTLGKLPRATELQAMLITAGWASLAAVFTFSIAMVVWGRHGDNSIKF